jgi:RNA polymerase sigma factor (sigma-70 family)
VSPWLSELFLRSQSDERLVSLAGAGHDRAFAAIVERYRPELQAHARRLSADGRAEDIVQQAFLSAFAALRSGTEVKHLRGWLYQIVRNAAIRSHAPGDVSIDDVTLAGAPLEDDVQARALALSALSEVGRLPERQREALVGTVQGRRRAEIAMSMGLSEGAVRQLVHRARLNIRAAITAVSPYPLARWLAAARPGAGTASEIAMTAGAASAPGAALKFGALIASGVVAGGIVIGIEPRPHPQHRAPHASVRVHAARGTAGRSRARTRAIVAGGGPTAQAVEASEPLGSGRGRGGRGHGGGAARGSDDRFGGSDGGSGRGGPGASGGVGGGGSGSDGGDSHSGPGGGGGSGSGSGHGSGSSGGGPGPSGGGSRSSGGGPGPSRGATGLSGGGPGPSPTSATIASDGSSGSSDGGRSGGGPGPSHGS